MMALLIVNQELCTKCGTCSESCAVGVIGMASEGPQMLVPEACNACGHCVAVCPNAALDHEKAPLKNQKPLPRFPVLDPETAADFIRSRRSIRNYEDVAVPRELIRQLLEIARFAPSGYNSQGLSYLAIDNKDLLRKIAAVTIDWLDELVKTGLPWAQRFAGLVEVYRNTGKDVILRDAPCLIVATAPADFVMGQDSARFALEYVELYATSFSLGTCWAGFVQMCAGANYQPLLELLKLTEGIAVLGTMIVGYPKHICKRLVDRNPLELRWVD